MRLYAPQSYWDAPQEARDEVCNGCGGKLTALLVPDTLYGLSIEEACNIHDWMYEFGVTQEEKEKADRVFLNNILRTIDYKTRLTPLKILRKKRAIKYYEAVSILGGSSFWEGKNDVKEYQDPFE